MTLPTEHLLSLIKSLPSIEILLTTIITPPFSTKQKILFRAQLSMHETGFLHHSIYMYYTNFSFSFTTESICLPLKTTIHIPYNTNTNTNQARQLPSAPHTPQFSLGQLSRLLLPLRSISPSQHRALTTSPFQNHLQNRKQTRRRLNRPNRRG